MPKNELSIVLRYLRALGEGQAATDLTDAELLERFRNRREEVAFVVLLQRHGPMVLSVCRRVLANREDAEDAFQATFLLLASRADSIRTKASLGSWLYGAAQRVALSARKGEMRRRARERRSLDMVRPRPLDEPTWEELRHVLDEELSHLPEKYRAPVVLCYLEGKTNEQAAQELSCPKSSLAWRLGRARELLRQQLTRRGITLPAGALTAVLMEQAATAALPALLVISTVRAAISFASSAAMAPGLVSDKVVSLTKGVAQAMVFNKSKFAVSLLLAVGIGGAGVVARARQAPKSETSEARQSIAPDIGARAGLAVRGEPAPNGPDVAGESQAVENKEDRRPMDAHQHLELMRWVITDVDASKGTISVSVSEKWTTSPARQGLKLKDVPVAQGAHILVNGLPAKIVDLRAGMLLSLRLAEDAPKITRIVAMGTQAASGFDVLEAVDLARRRLTVRLSESRSAVVFPVADNVEVVIDGKPARLADLQPHWQVSLQLIPGTDEMTVGAVRAQVMQVK